VRAPGGWKSALTEAAQANTRSRDSYLSAQYRRLKPRRGHRKAIGALRHLITAAAWHMLTTVEIYRDAGGDDFARLDPAKQTRRLVANSNASGTSSRLQEAAA
jgi:transposase